MHNKETLLPRAHNGLLFNNYQCQCLLQLTALFAPYPPSPVNSLVSSFQRAKKKQ